jgi:hypothetical protein
MPGHPLDGHEEDRRVKPGDDEFSMAAGVRVKAA